MKRWVAVTGWLAATALLVYFANKTDRAQLALAMSIVNWGWITTAIAANALILVSWAGLWWWVSPDAERPRYSAMFSINAMASALMNTMPFLGGHAAAVVLMVKRGGLSRPSALSVMALDQLGEGLAKVTIFMVVALAAPIPGWMRVGIGTVSGGVAALLLALVIAAHAHARIKPPETDGGRLTVLARGRLLAAHWAQRMETLRSVKRSIAALAFAVGTKLAEGAGLLAVQHAFGVHLSAGSTTLVLAAVVLGSILPVAPGNIGTYEAAAIIAYRHLGVDAGLATILALASHVCFMIPSVGIGYLLGSWKWLNVVPGSLEPQDTAARPTALS
jgi:glycosyltransferase 2 family protein